MLLFCLDAQRKSVTYCNPPKPNCNAFVPYIRAFGVFGCPPIFDWNRRQSVLISIVWRNQLIEG
jgi:hypothetical protein